MKKNSSFALMGLIGGILYGLADLFLYINSNLDLLDPDPQWAAMSAVRFLISMLIAVPGSCFLTFGYLATWRMLKGTGSRVVRILGSVGVMGVVATVCAHFLLGCIKPLIYKGMAAAGCEAQYTVVAEYVNRYTEIISLLAIFGVYIPHFASVCCLLGGRLGISRWRLAEVFGLEAAFIAVAELIYALGTTGTVGAAESVLEGLLCLIPFWYWKRQESGTAG